MRFKISLTVLGATALASMLPATVASADETNVNSHNGHRVSLIQTGQIDDPLEDVLEHAAILGTTYVFD
ncbi:hypothetical protein [Streptomyces albipurpureus]|uniref:Uncharacterized protein n=1 Tax=Streptomyces albipurpureus TaxID=2897419 RepID=A0ABT0USG9_9ACTN|nr:hypothetical protein [Streptomyces sp. CWNU-1]MCM2391395.1 hypothetical protein [Streptomyces sp. CWNU-1]